MANGAEAVLKTMRDLGAEVLFSLPGRGVYPLLNELPGVPELGYVNALHEFSLATAADGYARASGKAGFLNLYMSTGVMNASSALFLAHRDRVPLVVTATQTEAWAMGANARAETEDVAAIVRPYTKWAWTPPRADRIQEALIRAYTVAMTPPMGPTFVALPVDYFDQDVPLQAMNDNANLGVVPPGRVEPRVVEALRKADLPLIVMGGEAIRCNDSTVLRELAIHTRAAIAGEPDMPMLPLASNAAEFAGVLGDVPSLVDASDAIIYIGVNTLEPAHKALLESGRPKVHHFLTTDGREANKVVSADSVSIGSLQGVVAMLLDAVKSAGPGKDRQEGGFAPFLDEHAASWERLRAESWDSEPLSAARLFGELRKVFPPETILVEQATTTAKYLRSYFPLPGSESYHAASGSCQGWAVGAAAGVKIATPENPVMAVTGDGGLMFGVQSLWTAVHYDAPIVVVVIDNGGWWSMRNSVENKAPSIAEHGFELGYGWQMNYRQLAESFGAEAATVSTPDEIVPVARKALASENTFVIHAVCRRETRIRR